MTMTMTIMTLPPDGHGHGHPGDSANRNDHDRPARYNETYDVASTPPGPSRQNVRQRTNARKG